MVSNNQKAEKLKNYPNQVKAETAALTALSKGLGQISTVQGKEAKNRNTPLMGIQSVYD